MCTHDISILTYLLKKQPYSITTLKKNNINTKIVECKTVREKNGLAYSSRNNLLSYKEKIIASKIFKLLTNKKQDLIKNKFSLKKLKEIIYNIGVRKIDYIKVLDVNKLIIPFKKKRKYKIFIAYYLGTTRLIDNI